MPKQDDIGLAVRDKTGWRYATRPPQRFEGHEVLAVAAIAVGLVTIPDGADSVRLRAESNSVRWTADGVDPTAATGELLEGGDGVLVLENLGNDAIYKLRFIEVAGAASVTANYYRVRA